MGTRFSRKNIWKIQPFPLLQMRWEGKRGKLLIRTEFSSPDRADSTYHMTTRQRRTVSTTNHSLTKWRIVNQKKRKNRRILWQNIHRRKVLNVTWSSSDIFVSWNVDCMYFNFSLQYSPPNRKSVTVDVNRMFKSGIHLKEERLIPYFRRELPASEWTTDISLLYGILWNGLSAHQLRWLTYIYSLVWG